MINTSKTELISISVLCPSISSAFITFITFFSFLLALKICIQECSYS